jgi:hypothetical protein
MSKPPAICVHVLANDRNESLSLGRFLEREAVGSYEMPTTRAG